MGVFHTQEFKKQNLHLLSKRHFYSPPLSSLPSPLSPFPSYPSLFFLSLPLLSSPFASRNPLNWIHSLLMDYESQPRKWNKTSCTENKSERLFANTGSHSGMKKEHWSSSQETEGLFLLATNCIFELNITFPGYKVCVSCSFASDSLSPHGLQPARLLCPWDSPGKNTGEGYHFLLQGIFLTQGSNPHVPHGR